MGEKSGFAITDDKEFITEVERLAKEERVITLKNGLPMLNGMPLPFPLPRPLPPGYKPPFGYEVMEFEGTLPELLHFLMNFVPSEKK